LRLLLEKHGRYAEIARRALIALTRHDFGYEMAPWSEWWKRNHMLQRVEWLIAALETHNEELRKVASADLHDIARNWPASAPAELVLRGQPLGEAEQLWAMIPSGNFSHTAMAWKMWWSAATGTRRNRPTSKPPFVR